VVLFINANLKAGPSRPTRSLSDYQFRKFKVVIADSNTFPFLPAGGHQMAFQEHDRVSRPYWAREIGVLRQAPRCRNCSQPRIGPEVPDAALYVSIPSCRVGVYLSHQFNRTLLICGGTSGISNPKIRNSPIALYGNV